MKIAVLGGGPAGLYFSINMKKADPTHDITIIERNRPDDTFGWGVVFSDATLGNFAVADPESYAEIERNFHHWDDCEIFFKERRIVSGGHGFCGIGRRKLLNILQARAAGLGIRQQFETSVGDDADYADADLIVAADGVNSVVRKKYAEHFKPDIDVRKCRYIWLGTHLKLNAFTFITEPTEWGWFQVHAYQFDADTSTFIVECREETWRAAGLDQADQAASIAFCEKLFARYLQGHRLLSNARHLRGSAWLNFKRVLCAKWHHRNIVLIGGAALVMSEMTCVTPTGRITPGCAGLWNDEQAAGWKRIVDFVHTQSDAAIGIQLGHSGPKGSTQLGWEAIDEPLARGNWPLLAASAVRYGAQNQLPQAMTRADMDRVRDAFVAAARRADGAGFDLLELHCAHGYLLSSFLCPLTNRRDDEYGGALANRLRYPLEVFAAIREVWPAAKPMTVRISAHDWAPGGNTADDAVAMARAFKAAAADMIDVSSGQTTREARPVYGRMYQTPFADQIRNEVGIATIAVGNIFEADHVNSIIAAGRADLCALARPHLADAAWTLHAAARLGVADVAWPKQYLNGKAQLERNLARAAQMALNV